MSLFDRKVVSDTFGKYFNEVFDWIEHPESPIPTLLAPLTRSENLPIQVLDFDKIDVGKSQMFIHPVHEIFQTIVRTTPRPKPRGKYCSQSVQDAADGSLKLLPPEPKDYDARIDFYRQAFPPPCITLPHGKYLYIGSPNLLSGINRRRYHKVRFSLIASPTVATAVETVEEAVYHSFRLAFACLRDQPYYLRQDIRCRLFSIFRDLGLLPTVFGDSSYDTICEVLQIPPSTARAKKSSLSDTRNHS